jgi:hypothetical protein
MIGSAEGMGMSFRLVWVDEAESVALQAEQTLTLVQGSNSAAAALVAAHPKVVGTIV